MQWLAVIFAAVQCLQTVSAAHILGLCTVGSHSHSLWCYEFMSALADRGHQITVLGVDKPKIKIANLTTYIANEVYDAVFNATDTPDFTEESRSKIKSVYVDIRFWDETSSAAILKSKAMQNLIDDNQNNKKPFDLIIQDSTCCEALLGLVPLFGNPPLILATTFGSPQWMTFRVGNVFNPAHVPSMVTSADQYMTFYERCLNTFYYIFIEWFSVRVKEPFQDKLMRERFGDHLPYVRDIAKQANIIIVNHHFALNEPRPMLPGVVGISGLHISDPRPLPQDIKQFMDGAEHGVILFSLGSNVESSWLRKDFESIVLEALAQVPQRVLWKWDKEPTDAIPANIRISKWLPQGDMLAHPKMRLFITHCGLLSTQEAIYRKVPVLALPMFIDQLDNADMMVRRGLTIKLNIFKFTASDLLNGIQEILNNPKYKRNIEKLGDLVRDSPLSPQQQAVFWTEYAIRHQGAPHLRSVAADLPWHQFLLLDVLGLVSVLVIVLVLLVKKLLTVFCRCFVKKTTTSKSKKTN